MAGDQRFVRQTAQLEAAQGNGEVGAVPMAGNRAGNSVLEEKLTEGSLKVSLKGVFK